MSAILTAAIALTGVYIAFSLFTSWLNEQFAVFIALRSKTLVAGVRSMIGDAATLEFFNHPLILALGERLNAGMGRRLAGAVEPMVSKFTANVIGVCEAQGAPATRVAAQGPQRFPQYVSSSAFATVLTDVIRNYGKPATAASAPASNLGAGWSGVVAGLDALSTNAELAPLHAVLAPIWRQAQGDYDTFVRDLASWYDLHMDRVSGWYKRSAQLILLWIATLTVVALNVDSIQIWNVLQTNVNVGNAVAALTQAYATANAADIGAGKADLAKLRVPTQSCASSPGQKSPGTCVCPTGFVPQPKRDGSTPDECVADATTLAQLPIGWGRANLSTFERASNTSDFLAALLLKIVGLAITVIALMLGAPFWFDLLGSIVNVRSAGPPPPSSVAQKAS